EIWESFIVQSKIFKSLHIVDIQVDAVQRNIQFPIPAFYFSDVFFRFITPAALTKAKSPLGRDIAPSDHTAELMHNVFEILSVYIIQVHVPVIHGNLRSILLSIHYNYGDFTWIIQVSLHRLYVLTFYTLLYRIDND